MNGAMGKIVGGGLLIAGTAAVWLWPKAGAGEVAAEPLRPVRSTLVRAADTMPDLSFSGVVKAGQDRKLYFKQSGRIERIPVVKGQQLHKGDKLAWLVQSDFSNRLAQAEAEYERARLTCERMHNAAERNAVSQEELSKAVAAQKQSEAARNLAQVALEETVLYAPFDCLVADVPASELEMASGGKPVVVLLDLTTIKIDAAVPEVIVISQKQRKCSGNDTPYAVFDSDRTGRYPVEFVEYKSLAEARNQTFTATYRLKAPEELVLLPGMSATIVVPGTSFAPVEESAMAYELPESAVGIDADGSHYAWKLTPVAGEEGVYAASKCRLDGCYRIKGKSLVAGTGGLVPGDRIATAGVTVLTEGRRVTLIGDKAR